jgi:MerR family transcriptional regulator, light-induced transcriptional regulator
MGRQRPDLLGGSAAIKAATGSLTAGFSDCGDAFAAAQTRSGSDAPLPGNLSRLSLPLQRQIIPRLLLANRALTTSGVREPKALPEGIAIESFCRMVLDNDVASINGHVRELQGRGESLDTILLGLLAPTARHLGEMWKQDLCDFSQVTIGLWRLQQVVRDVCNGCDNLPSPQRRMGQKALLLPVPGEQHLFGLQIVGELLVRAGWDVTLDPSLGTEGILRTVRNEAFTVVGLTASSRSRLEGLAAFILRIRRASKNRLVAVMVGGSVFSEHPELAALVGADATAVDGQQAVDQAWAIYHLTSTQDPRLLRDA